jgi:hypothetical protein
MLHVLCIPWWKSEAACRALQGKHANDTTKVLTYAAPDKQPPLHGKCIYFVRANPVKAVDPKTVDTDLCFGEIMGQPLQVDPIRAGCRATRSWHRSTALGRSARASCACA